MGGDRTLFPIVGVGASAGGLEAFTELLKHLPLDTGMAFVLVQHLDPQHESALTQLLSRVTSLPVQDVTNDLKVEPNHVYVIPPNTNLSIAQGVLKLAARPKPPAIHRSVDFFFEALAQDQRERAMGVILSGTARDGTLGLEAIKAEGGITFAQDGSARYDSMPTSAVAAGCVDFVLAPMQIAMELARIAKHPHVAGQAEHATPVPTGRRASLGTTVKETGTEAKRNRSDSPATTLSDYPKILHLLRNHCSVDFSLYKSPTIERRIARRMVLEKHDTLDSYARFLHGNTKELDALYSDLLISVTSFFRNPEAFEVLQRKVFPKLLQQRTDDPVRMWVLGCSAGQEAYSLAMAFMESSEKASRVRKLQIFATDLNDAHLTKARHGLYAKALAQEISPKRLRRFFSEDEGGYRIIKPLREMVVFARQNLISDSPFSRLDLLSCRNLLIYLDPSLQQKALPMFHSALKPEGFLFLGASESVGGFTNLFEPVDKKQKIYSKKAAPTQAFRPPLKKTPGEVLPRQPRPVVQIAPGQEMTTHSFRGEFNVEREADRVTAKQFAPPGVLVNAELQVLQFRGATSAYLQPATGKASFDVLKMARQGLMLPLRSVIDKAKKDNKSVRKENIRLAQNGNTRTVNIEVIPLKNLPERCYLILFEETGAASSARGTIAKAHPPRGAVKATPSASKQESRRVADLQAELAETRDYLQSVEEQQEAANEELQAANEEVQSTNEELQSINEELETSKEELESTNEELTTINEEMTNRNAELNRLNSDLANFQASTKLAIVLVGSDLTIRRFSPQAKKQFGLSASHLGRPFGNVRHNLVFEDARPERSASAVVSPIPSDVETFVAEVIANVQEREHEVRDKEGRWYSLRARPYFTEDNRVDGAVLVLVDIDALKRSEQIVATARDFAEAIVQSSRDPLVILNSDLRVHTANEAFYRTFKVTPEETEGRMLYELSNREWDIPRLRELLEEILPRNSYFNDFEVVHDFAALGHRTMMVNARTLAGVAGEPARTLLGIQDVTEAQSQNEERVTIAKETGRQKDEFLAMLAHELRGPLAPIRNFLEIMKRAGGDAGLAEQARAAIELQVNQITRLIEDLVDASRVSRGKLNLRREQVELGAVVHRAVDASREAIEAAKHKLTTALPRRPIYLYADPVRLAQLLTNLLINACKYTEPGGQIALDVVPNGAEVVISIKDTGIGIPTEMLQNIFEMFVQVDQSIERTRGGLGIGLTLVRQLVEMHGGSVQAYSDGRGHGSEFVVRLPVQTQQTRPRATTAIGREPPLGAGQRILVVDDNEDAANSLATLLRMTGNETRVAHDGLKAVELAGTFRPDIVLLDIGLPKLNGYEACSRIREHAWGKHMVLVALTGWGQDEDRQKSKDAGFDGHLVKPTDLATLTRLLSGLLPSQV